MSPPSSEIATSSDASASAYPPTPPSNPKPDSFEITLARYFSSHSSSLHSFFLELDSDRDGYVSRSDLEAALHNILGVDLTTGQMDALFARFAQYEFDRRHAASVPAGLTIDNSNRGVSRRGGPTTPAPAPGVRYAEFARFVEETLTSPGAMNSNAVYGSSLDLHPAAGAHDGGGGGGEHGVVGSPRLARITSSPGVTTARLRWSFARAVRQHSGGVMKETTLFLQMDTARDGRVTVDEVREWARLHVMLDLTPAQARTLLNDLCDGCDGAVDLKSFARAVESWDDDGGTHGSMPWELPDVQAEERRASMRHANELYRVTEDASRIAKAEASRTAAGDAQTNQELVGALTERLVADAFRAFNVDGTNRMSAMELREALKGAGIEVSTGRAESLLGNFDRSLDGHLEIDDFARMITWGGRGAGEEKGAVGQTKNFFAESEERAPEEGDNRHGAVVRGLDSNDKEAILGFRKAVSSGAMSTKEVFKSMDTDCVKSLSAEKLKVGIGKIGVSSVLSLPELKVRPFRPLGVSSHLVLVYLNLYGTTIMNALLLVQPKNAPTPHLYDALAFYADAA